MRLSRLFLVGCLLGLVVWTSQPRAQQPAAAFYGIGDLPGAVGTGVGSAVRDATRVNGTIYAVGASTVNAPPNAGGVSNLDTPVLWTQGGVPTPLVALPPQTAFVPTQTTSISAFAITTDAEFIASQARRDSTTNVTNWVRVDQSLTNLNLSDAGTPAFAALALSDMGDVIYGMHIDDAGLRLPVRYQGGVVSFPDLSPTGRTWGVPLPRGTSTDPLVDGRFMVGIASNGAIAITQASSPVAFRYDGLTDTTSVIDLLDDGWWNMPVALTADGSQTVVIGNDPAYPLGQVYLTDAAGQMTATLGSPNTGFSPLPLGGMTADGVIGITFAGGFGPGPIGGLGIPSGNKHAYIHNSHGWFHFSSVLAAEEVDLSAMGWDPGNLAITGIRTVEGKDLVFGQGRRRTPSATGYVAGAVEGFVAELPAGVLAAFNPQPEAPANDALVGVWLFPGNPDLALAFLADGTYFARAFTGFERGSYTLAEDGAVTFTTLADTGGGGFSTNNGRLGLSYSIVGDEATLLDAYCIGCPDPNPIVRVQMAPGSIVGGWIAGDPTQADSSQLAVILDNASGNQYFVVNDGPGTDDDGVETGTYAWNAETGALTLSSSPPNETVTATLSSDELGLAVQIDEDAADPNSPVFNLAFKRVIAPALFLPDITNSVLEAESTEDALFSYQVTATNALTFEADGLPNGLTIDPVTGLISGPVTAVGVFNVTVTVTNTFGDTATTNLVLTFAPQPGPFYGIGDLSGGGVGSAVRDATRVNGTIYAVGASTVNATIPAVPRLDTPVLWTRGQAPSSLEALPNVINTHTSDNTAYAITPLDGRYIASQARASTTISGTNWVRVDRTQLASGVAANLNLGAAPGIPAFAALALSDDGVVVYGQRQIGTGGLPTETRVPVRYEVGGSAIAVDLTPTGREWGVPLPRGTSGDGRYMVGIASHGQIAITQASSPVAFRYDALTDTTSVIDLLTNGWWNMPLALAADGSQTVVIGNDPDYPLGQVYLTNAAGQMTATLGSPNTGFSPLPLGGMTADGVIGVTFAQGFGPSQINGLGIPPGNKHAYIHNSHGWFHFSSVLAAEGIDLSAMGWNPGNLAITGIRTVEGKDLVFGQGRRRTPSATGYVDGAVEGFVVELTAGVLASFNPQPVPPDNDALIGIWLFPSNGQFALAYLADGTYVARTGTSFERGSYTLAENGAFTLDTLHDTNGSGFSGNSGRLGLSYDIQGNEATLLDAYCIGCPVPNPIVRVPMVPGSIVGGWIAGDPTQFDQSQLAVLLDSASGNQYFVVNDGPGTDDGVETGTYAWDAQTGTLALTSSPPGETVTATLSQDELGLAVHVVEPDDDEYSLAFKRVIAPALVAPAITNDPFEATGTYLAPFSYQVTATYGLTYSALNLTPGLDIDAQTGLISGAPTAAGTSTTTLMVANTFGSAAQAELSITIAKATTSTTLTSSPNPSSPGQFVDFVATVTGQYGGPVTGTVTFRRGGNTILGTVEVGAGGIATLSLDNLGTGSHSVTATYQGDANSTGSVSAPVTQQVIAPSAPTTTTIASSLNPAVVGQLVTFTATVGSATPGTITGTVTLRSGQTELETTTLSGGQAVFTPIALPLGNSGMTAVYNGDAAYITSTSSSLTQSVIQAGTTTSLTTSPNPSNGGQLVTLTATVTAGVPGIPTPTGAVTFRRGQTVLGTQQVVGGGATLEISTLPAGSSNLVATYSGDTTYSASTSSTVTHVVNTGTTTTTLSSSAASTPYGTPVTFTAVVVSTLGSVPDGGVVEFNEGGTTHGTGIVQGGVATLTMPSEGIPALSLKNGKTATHNIKAKYLGDPYNSNSTSNTVAQVVTPP